MTLSAKKMQRLKDEYQALKWARTIRWIEQGRACFYCQNQISLAEATADHRRPSSKGGNSSIHNIDVVCRACNQAKGVKTEEEFRKSAAYAEACARTAKLTA